MADNKFKITGKIELNNKEAIENIKKTAGEFKNLQSQLKEGLLKSVSGLSKELNYAFKSKDVEKFSSHMKRTQEYIRKAESDVSKLQGGMKKLGENTDKVNNKAKGLRDTFERIGKALKSNLLYRIASGTLNVVRDLTESVVELDTAFAKIQAITRATDEDMSKLQSTIYRVGANSKFSLQELSEGAVILGQAGLSAQEVNEVLETTNQLAMATSSSLESSVDVMTSAIAVWGLNTEDAIRLSDAMVTGMNKSKATLDTFRYGIQYAGAISAQAGVSFEETFASLTLLADGGLKSSTAATSLRRVMNDLLAPSEKLKKQFKVIGLTEEDLNIETNGFVGVLKNLRDVGIDSTVALELFGVRGGQAYSNIYTHLDELEEMIRAMKEQGSTAEASAIQLNTFEGQWNRLRNVMTSSASSMGQSIKKHLLAPLKEMNEMLYRFLTNIGLLDKTKGLEHAKEFIGQDPMDDKKIKTISTPMFAPIKMAAGMLKYSSARDYNKKIQQYEDMYNKIYKAYVNGDRDTLGLLRAKYGSKTSKANEFDKALYADALKKAHGDYLNLSKSSKNTETTQESERTKEIKEKLKNLSSKPKGKMAKTDPELEAFKLRSTSATYESVLEEAERKGAQARLAFLDKSGTLSGAYSKTSSDVEELQAMRDAVTQKQILEDMKNKYSEVYEKVKLGNISIQEADRLNNNRISTILDLEKSVAEAEGRFGDLDNVDLSNLDTQIDNLKTKLEKIAKSGESPLTQLKEGFKVTIEDMKNQVTFASLGQTIANDLNTGMADALYNLTSGAKSFKEAFSDMAKSIIDDISKMLIKMAVYKAMAAGLNWLGGPSTGSSNPTGSVSTPTSAHAQGGMITGGVANRDSVHAMLMPGEYVLKKSAVDALGTNFLNDLNNNAAQTLAGTAATLSNNESESSSEPSIVNVWVVSKEENAQMGPNDVIATISKDILTGGQTKRLIQSVVAGRK